MRQLLRKYWEPVGLWLIILLGLFLRLIPAFRLEFWFDEAFSFSTRSMGFWEVVSYNPPHPPFFYWIIKFWSRLNTSQLFLRSVSIVFSLATAYLTFKLSKELKINKHFPLIAILFFTLHTLMIEQGFQLKMYSLVVLLMLLSIFSVFKAIKGQKRWLAVFCLANFLGILTDYAFIWYFISLFVGYLIIYLLSHFGKDKRASRKLAYLLPGFIVSIFLMITWLPVFIMNFKEAFLHTDYLFVNFDSNIQGIFSDLKLLFSIPFGFGNLNDPIFFVLMLLSIAANLTFIYTSFSLKNMERAFFWLVVGLFFYFSRNLAIHLGWFLPHRIFTAKNSIVVSLFPIFSLAGMVSTLLENRRILKKILGLFLLLCLVFVYSKSYLTVGYYKNIICYKSYSCLDAVEYLKKETDFSKDKLYFIRPWHNVLFSYFFYGYNENKANKNVSYNLGTPQDVLSKQSGTTFWLINMEQRSDRGLPEEEKIIYNFFTKCDLENNPIHYKKALIYKCRF